MAATNFTPIQLYYSATPTNVPLATNLLAGELAINTADGKLFYKDSGGTVQVIAGNANVSSFSAGTTGFTPSTATTGAVTLAGTLATTNGGTGLTSFTANGVVYASGTGALATGSVLVFDGANLGVGTATPYSAINQTSVTIDGTSASRMELWTAGTLRYQVIATSAQTVMANVGTSPLVYYINSTEKLRLTTASLVLADNPTLSAGTANGVTYLNGSNVLTSGSALTFDGTSLGVTAPGVTQTLIRPYTGGNYGAIYSGAVTPGGNNFVLAYNATEVFLNGNSYVAHTIAGSEQMRLTSTGLGIGTASPGAKLDVAGTAAISGAVTLSGGTANGVTYLNGSNVLTSGSALTFDGTFLTATRGITVNSSGIATSGFYNGVNISGFDALGWSGSSSLVFGGYRSSQWSEIQFYTGGSEQMRLTSTGLGIGTASPVAKLQSTGGILVSGAVAGLTANSSSMDFSGGYTRFIATGADTSTRGAFNFATSSSDASVFNSRMILDSSGNLGLEVTPSAWYVGDKAVEVTSYAAVAGNISSGYASYSNNAVQTGAGNLTGWVYKTTFGATLYQQQAGAHVWATAPSGTSGNPITFTQAMTLDASGNLGIGTASPGAKLDVDGGALIQGLTVGRGAGAVATNTAVGASALAANTTGSNQVAVGTNALNANTSGIQNVAVGTDALLSNQTGNYNTAVGVGSLRLNTAANNTAFGWTALNVNSSGGNNTAIGNSALQSNTTASNNTAVGYQAGYSNTTGYSLVAIGKAALYANTTGYENTAVGDTALTSNTTGVYNTAVGTGALQFNTTASSNTAMGLLAMRLNTTGGSNTAFGQQALAANTTASNNTAVGYQAGYSNTTGVDNVAMGYLALYSNTTAIRNVAVGRSALRLNTTGYESVAVGSFAMQSNTTGNQNTAVGQEALGQNTTANNNTAVGHQAGYSNTTGASNVFIGFSAGKNYSTGSYNTILGTSAAQQGVSTSNGNTLIGYGAGYNVTGGGNTFIGASGTGVGSGELVTSGSKNTILGPYNGNQGGLNISTLSNYLVLSDGDGNPRIYHNGTTVVIPNLPTSSAGLPTGGLYVLAGALMVA